MYNKIIGYIVALLLVVYSLTAGDVQAAPLDNTPPAASLVNITNVALNGPVVIQFSEYVDPSTITVVAPVPASPPTEGSIKVFIDAGAGTGDLIAGAITFYPSTNQAVFIPSAPLLPNTAYTVVNTAALRDSAGNTMVAGTIGTFATTATSDTITPTSSLLTTSNVAQNGPVTIQFSESIQNTSPIAITTGVGGTVQVLDPDGNVVAGSIVYDASTNLAAFTPAAPFIGGATYTVNITSGLTDLSGNALPASTPTFDTIGSPDTTSPTATLVTKTGVALNGPVEIQFDEAIQANTISVSPSGTVIVTDTGTGNYIAGSIQFSAATNKASFIPDAPFVGGASYTMQITTGVKDIAGNALANFATDTFVTSTGSDTTSPTATLATTSNVALNGPVVIQFSEYMQPGTITTTPDGTIMVVDSAGNYVAGTVQFDLTTNQASFTPFAPFASASTYTVYITTGLKDVAGNDLSVFTPTVFTTIMGDNVKPTAALLTKTNVGLSGPIVIQFNESMQGNTITTGASGSVLIKDPVGNLVDGIIQYDTTTNRASFVPTAAFAANANYTVSITIDPKDIAGNALTEFTQDTFTTTTNMWNVTSSSSNVSWSVSPQTTSVPNNGTITYTLTPIDVNYVLSSIAINGTPVVSPVLTYPGDGTTQWTSPAITGITNIVFTFVPANLTITASAGQWGTITPSGSFGVAYDSPRAFTITPAAGYSIATVTDTVGGVTTDVTASVVAGVYTLNNIRADHTIAATFTNDIVKPTITAQSPVSAAVDLSQGAVVTATFSESMDPATINSGTFFVKDSNNNVILGAVSYSGLVATFTPSLPLAWNTTFTATITTGVADTFGNTLAAAKTWSFTTRPGVYAVTLTPVVNGSVTSDAADLVNVADGSNIVFTITPNAGYHIADVTLDGVSVLTSVSNNSYTLNNVIAAHTVAVSFAINSYTLTTAVPGGNGTVLASGATANHGSNPTITITPAAGYHLSSLSVSGSAVSLSAPPANLVKGALNANGTYTWTYTINGITQDTVVSAVFSTLTLTGSVSGGNGVVTVSSATPNPGDSPTITIKPNVGYILDGLEDSIAGPVSAPALVKGAQNPDKTYTWTYTVNSISQSRTVTATFRKLKVIVTPPASGTGTVTPAGTSDVAYDASLSFDIVPANGYTLASITYNNASVTPLPSFAGGKYVYTTPAVTADSTLAVAFNLIPYYITATTDGNGTISSDAQVDGTGKTFVNHNSSAIFTIVSKPGFTLDVLTVDGVAVIPTSIGQAKDAATGKFAYSYSYQKSNITQNITVNAAFIQKYTVTATAGINGTISPAGSTVVSPGTSLTYSFTPASNQYQVSSLKVDGQNVAVANSYTFNGLAADHTIEVTFGDKNFTVAVAPAVSNGAVTLSSPTAPYGGTVNAVITPSSGYKVVDITTKPAGGVAVSVFANATATASGTYLYSLSTIQKDYEISATFDLKTYQITALAGTGGTISATNSAPAYNSSVTFTITPANGYIVLDLTVDGVSVKPQLAGNQYTLNGITSDHSVKATFAIITHAITSSVNNSSLGSISPNGVTRVNNGDSQKYQITVAAGAVLDDLLVDGVSVKSQIVNGSFTFANVSSAHTIVANFKASATVTYPDGDINLDGKIDISDVLLTLKMSVGLIKPTAVDISHADVGPMNSFNKPVPDGKVDIDDVVVLLQRTVGNIPAW